MALEITGRLTSKLPVQSGTSSRGEWTKQEFILETTDDFRRKVCISVWGADQVAILSGCREGEILKVSFNIESREYNQRWYTDVRAWRIVREESEPAMPGSPVQGDSMEDDSFSGEDGSDDLPF
jgi:hypothetical protein